MKIVGQLVCGPNEKYLEKTLQEFARLCDDVIVATCNATEREINLLKKYDFRNYQDNREWGKHQPDIKTDLLTRIHRLGADAILVLDADESLPTTTRRDLEQIGRVQEAAQFFVVDLWNDEQHYKKSLSFWNIRFYCADPTRGTQFLRKPLHCGNAPPYFYALPARDTYVPHLLVHRGLMDPADRQRKWERYQQYDPQAIHKGREYYDALLTDTAAEYNQNEVLKKVQEYCARLKSKR